MQWKVVIKDSKPLGIPKFSVKTFCEKFQQVVVKDSKPLEIPKFSVRGKFQWVCQKIPEKLCHYSWKCLFLPKCFSSPKPAGAWCAACPNHCWEAWCWRKVKTHQHRHSSSPHTHRRHHLVLDQWSGQLGVSSIELSVQRVESGGELSKAATSDIMNLQVGLWWWGVTIWYFTLIIWPCMTIICMVF